MTNTTLFIQEVFDSIQGETSYMGIMTTFIRVAGCPLRCSWCDSTYTFGKGTQQTITELTTILEQKAWKYVCITGGEPLAQPGMYLLIQELLDKDYILSLETSGCLPINSIPKSVKTILDIKPPSSNMCKKNLFDNIHFLSHHDEIKFVLANRTDYEWAKQIIVQYKLFDTVPTILFSPVWGVLCPKTLVSWIREDILPVRCNFQLHKYIWGETIIGV